ncbi:Hypothetical predicted protein [Xyrichtys novacula]|uniref:Uncharacterized protein n=1 Tax=Xyrichtys novacula TaxID=13765 RepID=A0AAV1G3K6_XYRNO|nr:Hypothetical predicted protein [Xyrichtys novacula]
MNAGIRERLLVYFRRMYYLAGGRSRMMEWCGNERGPDQHRFVPDVTDHKQMSRFTILLLHKNRQAMTDNREASKGPKTNSCFTGAPHELPDAHQGPGSRRICRNKSSSTPWLSLSFGQQLKHKAS